MKLIIGLHENPQDHIHVYNAETRDWVELEASPFYTVAYLSNEDKYFEIIVQEKQR